MVRLGYQAAFARSIDAVEPNHQHTAQIIVKQKKLIVVVLLCFAAFALLLRRSPIGVSINVKKELVASNVRLLSLIDTDVSAEEFRKRCIADPSLVHEWDEHFGSPIDDALSKRRFDLAEVLLDLGVDPNSKVKMRDWHGDTLLIFAVHMNEPEAVKLLLSRGADPQLTDSNSKIASDYVDESKSSEIRELLKNKQL